MVNRKVLKMLFYKNAESNFENHNLQELLKKALEKCPKPKNRMESIDTEGTIKRVINAHTSFSGMLFGEMLMFEPDKDQAILVMDDESDSYPIDKITAPRNKDGKKQEFLQSVFYFGVLENHVIISQSQALRAKDFENHLLWLLIEHTSTLSTDKMILLSDQPTKKAREAIEKSPVKKVVIGSGLETKVDPKYKENTKEKEAKFKFIPIGRGFDILTAVLGANWREKLKLEDSLEDSNLQVNLEITYLRKTSEYAHAMLDNIATSLRHSEPDDVKVHIEGGGLLTGKDLKISGKIYVSAYNGIVDSIALYNIMHEWLKQKIGADEII